jgi:restriction system protein
VVFNEDGSLDPLLKFLLYVVIALAIGKMLWEWLTEDVGQWIAVDLWGLITDHPWWTGLIVASGLSMLLLLGRFLSFVFGADTYAGADDAFVAASGDAIEADVLAFKMKQLLSMSATGFEQACTDLLARDGFRRPMRVGGAGDRGVDVTARDDEDRLLIVPRQL